MDGVPARGIAREMGTAGAPRVTETAAAGGEAGPTNAADGGSRRPGAPRRQRPVPWFRWAVLASVACAILAAYAAGATNAPPETVVIRLSTATPTGRSAATPVPGAAVPASAAVLPALEGPLLGGLRTTWIEARGQPSLGVFGELFAGTTGVRWHDDATGQPRAMQVELLTGANLIPVGKAREMASRLHPSDAKSIGVYRDALGQTVELFHSDDLAAAFGGADSPGARAVFGTAAPGTFIQIAERRSPTTKRVLLAVGNPPNVS